MGDILNNTEICISILREYADVFEKKLDLDCSNSISIENTIENCNSSIKAKLPTLFYPGEYTFFRDSDTFTNDIFKSVKDFFKES